MIMFNSHLVYVLKNYCCRLNVNLKILLTTFKNFRKQLLIFGFNFYLIIFIFINFYFYLVIAIRGPTLIM